MLINMKIALSGTHNCGKTTLLLDVYSKLKDLGYKSVGILPEIARICPFAINQETTFKSQYWILTQHIFYEIILQEKYEILLCDRTVVDNLAYANFANEVTKKIDTMNLMFLIDIAKKWYYLHPSYDLIFYLEQLSLEKDGVRSTDISYQKQIDKSLKSIFKKLDIETISIPNCKREERVKMVLDNIAKIKE